MVKFNRRKFIASAGAVTITQNFVSQINSRLTANPINQNFHVANSNIPEIKTLTLGFVPVVSACPLIIAKAKGFFTKYGMPDIKVIKQPSWSVMRDKLMLGGAEDGLDGGHLLFPMAYLLATGEISYGIKIPVYILARLNVNGQGISVANTYENLKLNLDSSPLKPYFAEKIQRGETVRCAVPYRRVTGDFFMRWWLGYGGIDPDKDTSIIVVPPPQMVASMRSHTMEAFCVVDPWHERLLKQKLGYSTLTSGELWNNHPEKALVARAEWVDKYPQATKAILAAVMEAQIWCDQPENKQELAEIVSQRQWIGAKSNLIFNRLVGKFDYGNGRVVENSPHTIKYWCDYASYPFKSHDLWFFIEDMRWGFRSHDFEPQPIIDAVNREDLWRETAKFINQGVAIPPSTSRGVERFFNGLVFDPQQPQAYLDAPKIRNS
jgi:nitrate/nitrite transport system substrate-binding protein